MGYSKFIRELAKYLGVKCNVALGLRTSEVQEMAREKRLPLAEIHLLDKSTGESKLLFTLGERRKRGRR